MIIFKNPANFSHKKYRKEITYFLDIYQSYDGYFKYNIFMKQETSEISRHYYQAENQNLNSSDKPYTVNVYEIRGDQTFDTSYQPRQSKPKNCLIIFYSTFTILSTIKISNDYLYIFFNPQLLKFVRELNWILGIFTLICYAITILANTKVSKMQNIPLFVQQKKRANWIHYKYAAPALLLNQQDQDYTDGKRNCKICDYKKMPRVSHCSSCGHCLYRLDHHCIWTQSCIGYINQKSFLLFIGGMQSGIILFVYYSYLSIHSMLYQRKQGFFSYFSWYIYLWWFIVCISTFFVGCMISFVTLSQIGCTLTNFTTLNGIRSRQLFPIPVIQYRKQKLAFMQSHVYDRGQIQNVKSIFGANSFWAFFPNLNEVDNQFFHQKTNPYPTERQWKSFTGQLQKQYQIEQNLRQAIKVLLNSKKQAK